jgi:DNA-binding NarL/FixJ family response regulator
MDMELLTVNKIKVLIADDHLVVREGLMVMLQSTGECEVIGQATNGEEAVLLAHKLQPDVAIVDLQMPGMGGIEAIQRITQQTPKVKVVVLSTFDQDEYIYQSVQAGAKGYVLKGSGLDELLDVVRSAATGKLLLSSDIATKLIGHISTPDLGLSLTEREREVLRFLARGWRNREIAQHLCISERTVKNHVTNIITKLGVKSRTEAVSQAFKEGLIKLD